MAGSLKYDNDYLVAGAPNAKVSPNFRCKEFVGRNGKLFVHRELIASLQVLRDRANRAVNIKSLAPGAAFQPAGRGLCLTVTGADVGDLLTTAEQLRKDGYFTRVQLQGDEIYLEVPVSNNVAAITPQLAFDCGVQVTAAYETSGDPYQQVTGNFDGAGLSFGPIQVNLGTGTLQDVFRRLRGEDEVRLRTCFDDNEADYSTFWRILDGSRNKAVQWADGLSAGSRKQSFSNPWKTYLQAVGREPLFRQIMLRYAYDKYGKLLMAVLAFLDGISPVRITNLRCLAALYDMGVQQGSLRKAHDVIRQRILQEQPNDEFALTRLVVEERAKTARKQYQADCLSRRLGILQREPVAVTLAGVRARRRNDRVYLLRDCPVKGVEDYLAE